MLVVAVLCLAGSLVRADDAADVRKAFDTFVQYTKTDDERTLDLFTPDIAVTFYYDAGRGIHEMTLPTDKFREMVTQSLAKKEGNSDQYENIECNPDGDTVKLTCTLIAGKTGEHAPLNLVYVKDGSGAFKIKAMRLKVPPPKTTPGS